MDFETGLLNGSLFLFPDTLHPNDFKEQFLWAMRLSLFTHLTYLPTSIHTYIFLLFLKYHV